MRDIRAGVLTALVGLVAAGGSLGADEVTGQGGKVGPVPDAVRDRLGLGDWYTQAAEAAGGIPVVASTRTNPLAALLTEVFGADPWLYRRPAERPAAERAHLRGFDPASGPAFNWDRLGDGGDKPGPG
jgi:hypothetical protein